jgi:hypothetical protein
VVTEFGTDLDRDGLGDALEAQNGWNPQSADTDGDGFPDGFEFEHGGDPGSADRNPEILSVELDRESLVLIATVQTFEGAAFFIEALDEDGDWLRVGEAIAGNGVAQEFVVPLGGDGALTGLLRAGFTEEELGANPGGESETDGQCQVPDSLVGSEMVVNGGRRLCFKSKTRGEEVQGQGGGMLVTSFGYTFKRSGRCTARLTLTFNTGSGIETTVYTLTFGADGRPGAFAARSFEGGAGGSRSDGNFTMNP